MLKSTGKLVLLAAAVSLPYLHWRTAPTADAEVWEACIREHNPHGYRFLKSAAPSDLMAQTHWTLYLDSYELKSYNIATHLWSFTLHYKDVQLMLRAHRHPEHRASLTPAQREALGEAEQWVARLTSPGMSDLDKARALHDELVTTCTYSLDGAQNATDLFRLRSGTCEAYGRTLQLLLELAGVRCELVYGTASPAFVADPNTSHCWNKAFLDGRWLYIDPAWDAIDSSPGAPSRHYFALPASALRSTHIWQDE